jgi:hypothetical protein
MKTESTKFLVGLISMVALVSVSSPALADGFERVLQCNDSAVVVDRGNGINQGEAQFVLQDQGVLNFFREKIGYLYTNSSGHYVEKTFQALEAAEFGGKIDFSEKYQSQGDGNTYPSIIMERKGNGLLVELVRVSVWYSDGLYDETTGTWRLGTSQKRVEKVANWYFENCTR